MSDVPYIHGFIAGSLSYWPTFPTSSGSPLGRWGLYIFLICLTWDCSFRILRVTETCVGNYFRFWRVVGELADSKIKDLYYWCWWYERRCLAADNLGGHDHTCILHTTPWDSWLNILSTCTSSFFIVLMLLRSFTLIVVIAAAVRVTWCYSGSRVDNIYGQRVYQALRSVCGRQPAFSLAAQVCVEHLLHEGCSPRTY